MEVYNKRVDAYNAAIKADKDPGPPLEQFKDPGRSDIQSARQADARRQRDEAGRVATQAVTAALKHAPAEPPPLDRLVVRRARRLRRGQHRGPPLHGRSDRGERGADQLLFSVVRPPRPLQHHSPGRLPAARQHDPVRSGLDGRAPGARSRSPHRQLQRRTPREALGRLVPQLIGTDGAGLAVGGLRTAVREGVETGAANMATNGLSNGDELAAAPKDWSNLARSTDHVLQKAIHADVDRNSPQEFTDDQFPWLKDVNRTGHPGYTQNCSHNVDAVNRNLDGEQAGAAPKQSPDHVPPEVLGLKDRPKGHYDMVNSYDDVIRDLQARGEGSRSVMYISRSDGSAHVFNAVNTPHEWFSSTASPGPWEYSKRMCRRSAIFHIATESSKC